MIAGWLFRLKRQVEKLWVTAVLYALLAVATVGLTRVIGPWVPQGLGSGLDAAVLESVLTILASSMLTVTTFSLGIMLTAFSTAAASITPRAIELLMRDRTTQQVLSVFLGAFIFGLVALIAVKAGLYGDRGRLVLFAVTVGVVVLVVMAMLRWIAHLTRFGRRGDTNDRIESAAARALQQRIRAPYLGGHRLAAPPPGDAVAVLPQATGYVQYVDMGALQAAAEAAGARVWLDVLPGSFVHPGAPVCRISAPADVAAFRSAFGIGAARTFEQDPRFGLCVLAEVAERALSPAVNDPGSAIEILSRVVRLLADWSEPADPELLFPSVWVPPLRIEDMFEDVFDPIARDGAGVFSVQARVQKSLLALVRIDPARFGRAAVEQSGRALRRAKAEMLPEDHERLAGIAAEIAALAEPRAAPGI
ncbi:DUF2254 domain-containing protein [Aliigemmobacter aestuarii]|uniref:DUF2254 domain-containing protein n=1 Tax=Aliigemmobacter aestuarii TaxID=1445661 RepID=A0A4S3MJQ7_9RHOB|nr:DUF2254 domain-containing protein [Gemmobacter aestuarii]THD81508.1 DUF2254 domain-containing protein [Gemmobacter aestuarii]